MYNNNRGGMMMNRGGMMQGNMNRGGMMMNRGGMMMNRGGMMMNRGGMMHGPMNNQGNANEERLNAAIKNLLRLSGVQRVTEEYKLLQDFPIVNISCSVGLPDRNNMMVWRFTLNGPSDSPYANGLFYLKVTFPKDYPKKKPEVQFLTPIYHINVKHLPSRPGDNEGLGHVCISTINYWEKQWQTGLTMRNVMTDIFALFYCGNPQSPYGLDRQTEMTKNRALYDQKCRDFTKKYAQMTQKVPPIQGYPNWDFTYPCH